jgi:GNAT superfamily N-acetyltransferase
MKVLSPPLIKIVDASEQYRVFATLSVAFEADPAFLWLYPTSLQYRQNFVRFVHAFGGAAFEHGTAFVNERYDGASLWLPPGAGPDEEAMAILLQESVPEEELSEVFAVFEEMSRIHPTEPHWYLPLLGVAPHRQNRGFGSAMMKHALQLCDRDRLPAYLEATSPRNVPLYQRHGFEVIGRIQTGSSPPIFPMLRPAR